MTGRIVDGAGCQAGEYYAVAGPVHWNRACAGLIGLVREGRTADLDAARVARFNAQGTTQQDVQIDAAATEQAIFSLVAEN